MTNPIIDGLCDKPPQTLMDRPVLVQNGQLTTYRLMQDVALFENRFVAKSFTEGSFHNEVRYLVNAEEAFPAMLAAIKTAKGDSHFVYFINWYLGLDVPLSGPGGSDSLRSLLPTLATAGVQCRAMLFRNTIMAPGGPRQVFFIASPGRLPPYRIVVVPIINGVTPPPPPLNALEFVAYQRTLDGPLASSIFDGSPDPWWAPGLGSGPPIVPQNSQEVDFFNALTSPRGGGFCAAILDHLVPIAGAHHQKILLVNGSDGLIAFAGGLDINNDRYTYLYDVHAQVKGPAARDVLSIFNERWNAHPDRAVVEKGQSHLGNATATPAEIPTAVSQVQVGRTYADGGRARPELADALTSDSTHDLAVLARHFDPFSGYPFAGSGATQVWEMYKAAIGAAKNFIYIENQYFVSTKLAHALKSVVPKLRHVTLVVEPKADMDYDRGFHRTKTCLDILRSADPSGTKVRVMSIKDEATVTHRYVHSKTMIIDDNYAIIGTANGARRSFNCDSEEAVGVFDWLTDRARFQPSYCFAHRLRVRLWAELLGMNDAAGYAQLADPIGAIVHWEEARAAAAPLRGSLVWDYAKMANPGEKFASDEEWDFARDPFNPGPT